MSKLPAPSVGTEKRDDFQKRKHKLSILTDYRRLVFVWSTVLVLQEDYKIYGEADERYPPSGAVADLHPR